MEADVIRTGFCRYELRSSSGLSYTFFCCNTVDVLKEQVQECSDHEIIYISGEQSFMSNPFNAEISIEACIAVRKAIICSEDSDVSWKAFETDAKISTVGCVQRFSDKSQTAHFASS